MSELRLYAIGIDELRDVFSGSPDVAANLRSVALAAFPAPPRHSPTGMLSKLGPLFRRPPEAPVIRPGVPTEHDLLAVVSGRFIPPERVPAAWALVRAYLEAQSWGSLPLELSQRQLDELEFDLAKAGMSSAYGLRKLFVDPLGVPLNTPPGMVAGFVHAERVDDWRRAWDEAAAQLEGPNQALARSVADWLELFPAWAEAAMASGRSTPDAIALFEEQAG